MDVHEALYTTGMMRRMRPDPIPVEVQGRILDAAIRTPSGANAQRRHFIAVDDATVKAELAALNRTARVMEHAEISAGTLATVLRYQAEQVHKLLGVPTDDGWRMTAMLALGYPLGRWGVAANRRPVHEVSSRNHWDRPYTPKIPEPLWGPADA